MPKKYSMNFANIKKYWMVSELNIVKIEIFRLGKYYHFLYMERVVLVSHHGYRPALYKQEPQQPPRSTIRLSRVNTTKKP